MTTIEINASVIVESLRQQARTRQFQQADDTTYFANARITDADIIMRQLVERAIVRCAVTSILAIQAEDGAAYGISVHDGEETVLKNSRDLAAIMDAIMSTDEDMLVVRRLHADSASTYVGSINLIYGNDGWDVIANNSMSVESMLEGATKLAEALSDAL
ncbi:hypothetical protein BLAT2472_170019 [Burkholderia latens]|uniref:hypothetical protein n=1 Tax=Burkholderia latens TaxID=488446 RepID=UPI0039A63090